MANVTNWEEIEKKILGKIKDLVIDAGPLLKNVAWPNIAFEPPKDRTANTEDIVYWFRVQIQSISQRQATRGGLTNLHRQLGRLTFQLFVSPDSGTGSVKRKADEIAALFRSVTYDGVRFQSPDSRDVGLSDGWYQVNVHCPFYVDLFF